MRLTRTQVAMIVLVFFLLLMIFGRSFVPA
jgi:hypothetical protein